MKQKPAVIISIVAAALIVGAGAYALVGNRSGETETVSQTTTTANPAAVQQSSESELYQRYAAMTGEAYDRNFVANMIAHHQGAVDMARLALANAKRQELKDMAREIVTVQEKEISNLQNWQKEWGYPSTSAENMQDHSAMGMMDEMSSMTAGLQGKTGDDFDRAFIAAMIEHHQSALDMARPGEQNAMRQEVKDTAKAIVEAQTQEIAQLRQWQSEWGYGQ